MKYLLVGAASGSNIQKYDTVTGVLLGNFASGGPLDGGYSCPVMDTHYNIVIKMWSVPQIGVYDGKTGLHIRDIPDNRTAGFSNILINRQGELLAFDDLGNVNRYDTHTGNFLGVYINNSYIATTLGLHKGANPITMRLVSDNHFFISVTYGGTAALAPTWAVLHFDQQSGTFLEEYIPKFTPHYDSSLDFIIDRNHILYAANHSTSEIIMFDLNTRTYKGVFASGGGLMNPISLLFGPDGDLYVVSETQKHVYQYDGKTGAFKKILIINTSADPTYLLFAEIPLVPFVHKHTTSTKAKT